MLDSSSIAMPSSLGWAEPAVCSILGGGTTQRTCHGFDSGIHEEAAPFGGEAAEMCRRLQPPCDFRRHCPGLARLDGRLRGRVPWLASSSLSSGRSAHPGASRPPPPRPRRHLRRPAGGRPRSSTTSYGSSTTRVMDLASPPIVPGAPRAGFGCHRCDDQRPANLVLVRSPEAAVTTAARRRTSRADGALAYARCGGSRRQRPAPGADHRPVSTHEFDLLFIVDAPTLTTSQ